MRIGIFGKMFLYTLTFLLITVSVTAFLFAGQFKAFYDFSQRQVLSAAFAPLMKEIEGKSPEEIIIIASQFHEENPQYQFSVSSPTKNALFVLKAEEMPELKISLPEKAASGLATPGASLNTVVSVMDKPATAQYRMIVTAQGEQVTLAAFGVAQEGNGYKDIIQKLLIGLLILIAAGVAGAALIAREMTLPIKRLASETSRMSALLPVERPRQRYDELGQLEQDVHDMYDNLKRTITELENEEENQRYFFSAASHELKTPIAAISALLEGMLANIGDYKDHSKYLRECLKMTKGQNRIISEILDIVNISGGKIKPVMEQTSLRESINGILPEYNALAARSELEIIVSVPDDAICIADKKMLARSLSNVIMNAIQNTPPSERVIIESTETKAGILRLSVTNTNSHIDDDMTEKLFEPFYRMDKARSRTQGRSGLGLSIVKKLLEVMNIPFGIENGEKDGKQCVVFHIDLITE